MIHPAQFVAQSLWMATTTLAADVELARDGSCTSSEMWGARRDVGMTGTLHGTNNQAYINRAIDITTIPAMGEVRQTSPNALLPTKNTAGSTTQITSTRGDVIRRLRPWTVHAA
jgi:hypothetical protein